MAKPQREGVAVSPSYDPSRRTRQQKAYFFLDETLYKMIKQEKSQDLLYAYRFEPDGTKGEMVTFLLSEVKKKMKNAYDTVEVAAMLNRKRQTMRKYLSDSKIRRPIQIGNHGRNGSGHPFGWMKWREDQILDIHTFLLTSPRGPARKDGILKPAPNLPSRRELLAILRDQPMFYMKSSSGEMIPVWKAYDSV